MDAYAFRPQNILGLVETAAPGT